MGEIWDVAKAVWWRNVRLIYVKPMRAIIPMLIPMIFFATFAGGLSGLTSIPGFPEGSYTTFQFVFVWLQAGSFQGMFSGFSMANDWETGFAKRLMIAAPNRTGIIVGYLLSTITRMVVLGILLFGIGLAVGVEPTGNWLEITGLILLGFVIAVIGSFWSGGVAMRFRTMQAGPLMQMPIFVLLFLSPVFVPLALLTGWVRKVANVNPITVFMEEGRALISGQDPRWLAMTAVAAAFIVVTCFWSYRGLRAAERGE